MSDSHTIHIRCQCGYVHVPNSLITGDTEFVNEPCKACMDEVKEKHDKLLAGIFDKVLLVAERSGWKEEQHLDHWLKDILMDYEIVSSRESSLQKALEEGTKTFPRTAGEPFEEWIYRVADRASLLVKGVAAKPPPPSDPTEIPF